jgi:hypothetical protein
MRGRAALRRAGFDNLSALFDKGMRAFWEKRLRLFSVDVERLGRAFEKRQLSQRLTGRAGRKAGSQSTHRTPLRNGRIILRCYPSVEALVDDVPFARAALIRVPATRLLPPSGLLL